MHVGCTTTSCRFLHDKAADKTAWTPRVIAYYILQRSSDWVSTLCEDQHGHTHNTKNIELGSSRMSQLRRICWSFMDSKHVNERICEPTHTSAKISHLTFTRTWLDGLTKCHQETDIRHGNHWYVSTCISKHRILHSHVPPSLRHNKKRALLHHPKSILEISLIRCQLL